jgi:hypothetical protein
MREVQGGQVDGLKAEVFVTSILKFLPSAFRLNP